MIPLFDDSQKITRYRRSLTTNYFAEELVRHLIRDRKIEGKKLKSKNLPATERGWKAVTRRFNERKKRRAALRPNSPARQRYNAAMRVLVLSLVWIGTVAAQTRLAGFVGTDKAHVWGRINAVTKSGLEVDQNFNADPQSGYRRGKRLITFNSETEFQESTRQDVRVGRTVDIIGVEDTNLSFQATRVIVYDGNAPVRMIAGARVIAPDGSVRVGR